MRPTQSAEIKLGALPRTKVVIGRAVGVFDPDGSMLTKDKQVFVSIMGCGGHGDHDCSFSNSDVMTDLLRKNNLKHIWSLRSVTATGEGRMYMGDSAPVFHLSEQQQYTGLNQYRGKYSVAVSGIIVAVTGRRGKASKQNFAAQEFVLDTGVCVCVCVCVRSCVCVCVM